MLILLQALIQLLLQILKGMVAPFVISVLGAAVVAGFLWLAMFPWKRNIETVVVTWLMAGLVSALAYSIVIYVAPVLKGTLLMFLSAVVMGAFPFFFLRGRAPNNKQFRWWVLYVAWLYVWFTLLIGWRYGLGGMVFITVPAFIVAFGMAFILAGKVLPFPDPVIFKGEDAPAAGLVPTFTDEIRDLIALLRRPENSEARREWIQQRRMALRTLISYALGTHYDYYVVIDEKITERTEDVRTWLEWKQKLVKRLTSGDLLGDFLAGPGVILTGCDHAVALSTGTVFKGVRGPGVIFTESGERPVHVIDLRGQLLAFMVNARTKDGIAIKAPTAVPFRIDAGRQKAGLGTGFPYYDNAVFKAIHAQPAKHEDASQSPQARQEWYDLPREIAERVVRDAVSHYNFDELYDPQVQARAEIGKRLAKELDEEFEKWGLHRIGSGVGNLEPQSSQAQSKRVAGWQSGWQRKIRLKKAQKEHEKRQRIDRVIAEARKDLILELGKRIRELHDEHMPMDRLAIELLNTLEVMSTNSVMHPFISLRPDEVFRRVYKIFGVADDAGRKAGG